MRGFIILVLLVLSFNLYSQSTKQLIHAGKKAYHKGNFESAEYYFGKALEQEQSASLAWLMAEASRQNHDYEIAEKWYSFIVQNDNETYPLASFWLGIVQKNLGKYQRAQISFRKYLQKHAATKDYYTAKSRHEILSCENALFMTFDKSQQEILTFDSTMNSPYSEFQATKTSDSILWLTAYKPLKNEDSLLFTSKLLSFKMDSLHATLLPIDTIINNAQNFVSSFAFMNQNKIIILSLCRKTGISKFHCRLYRSQDGFDHWSVPELLPPPVNEETSSSTHPYVIESDTARYLLFASDRKGGYGGYDLWAIAVDSLCNPMDTAFNLGKNVNSIDNEVSPFYDLRNKTLYFSSEWFTNLGGMDIFSSYGWIKNLYPPQNLGYPLNTNHNEVFYQISQDKSMALFTSNRVLNSLTGNEKCCNDVFYIPLEIPKPDSSELVQIQLQKKKKVEELIPVTLYFHNDEPNPRTYDTTTLYSYSELYDKYIAMRYEYIKMYGGTLKENEKEQAESSIDNFFVDEVEKNYLKLLNFLQLLKDLLANGQKIEIIIKGYASPLNNHAYNLNLSKRRVQSLVNLLYKFEDGVFIPYLDGNASGGGKLIITREAFGENMVAQGVSDDLRDQRNSVFSPAAAHERKIAIIAIKIQN